MAHPSEGELFFSMFPEHRICFPQAFACCVYPGSAAFWLYGLVQVTSHLSHLVYLESQDLPLDSSLHLESTFPPSLPIEILLMIPEVGPVPTVQNVFFFSYQHLHCHFCIVYHKLTYVIMHTSLFLYLSFLPTNIKHL